MNLDAVDHLEVDWFWRFSRLSWRIGRFRHVATASPSATGLDGRVKPGHDEVDWEATLSEGEVHWRSAGQSPCDHTDGSETAALLMKFANSLVYPS